jgi:hypothetical protein
MYRNPLATHLPLTNTALRLLKTISPVVALIMIYAAAVISAHASGRIDASTLVSKPHGSFSAVRYVRYEAMFEGVTSNNRPYRVPCQIIAPADPRRGSGTLLFDWLVPSTIATAVGQEQADARYTMTDDFLFGLGLSYATVRSDPEGIGRRSPIADPTRPWSDGLLDTSSEYISSAGDEFDIIADYVKALRSDPVALELLGRVRRTAGFGYSASGYRLKGMLRINMGVGLFDFSLVGGAGSGFDHPVGNAIGHSSTEKAPKTGAGLEINFQSETDVVVLEGYKTRREESNYRLYQFAGATHIRDVDAAEFGLVDPAAANPADWVPFFRALFVAGYNWCDAIEPPPSIWLGAPNDASIARDARGNALVRYVGGQSVNTSGYRLPEVAVGQNQYIPFAPQYNDGTFLGLLRSLGGGHIDLTHTFVNHNVYVDQVTSHARTLQAQGYLLRADADAIIREARDSSIGYP